MVFDEHIVVLAEAVIFEAGRFEVLVKVGLEGEGFVAALALEVLVGRVGLHMGSQIASVGKGFATMCTPIWFFTGVRTKMTLKEPGPREELSANVTAVRQFVR